MSNYFRPRERSPKTGTQFYYTPMSLAGALAQLERLTDKRSNPDIKNKHRRAGPGCVVDLLDLKDESRASFELVMPDEATLRTKQISVLSPLGSSLLGLKKGDISRVKLWGSSHKFQVLGIHYDDPVSTGREETPS